MNSAEAALRSDGPEIRAARTHVASRLNWLRAGVLGANDGIVSVAGLVVGVAAATRIASLIFAAGLAGLIPGAVSMALGEPSWPNWRPTTRRRACPRVLPEGSQPNSPATMRSLPMPMRNWASI